MISFVQIFFMRPIAIFLAIVGVAIITWLVLARPDKKEEESKNKALSVSKHSAEFNASVAAVLSVYDKLSESFVNWDSVGSVTAANTLMKDVDNINMEEIKKDSSAIYETATAFIENAKGDLQTIASEKGIRQQRKAFHNLTDNIHQFLNTVKYDSEILYLQECPMAFDDVETAQWISKSGEDKDRRNPYLGLKDPKYGKGMLKCGETIKEINHTGKGK